MPVGVVGVLVMMSVIGVGMAGVVVVRVVLVMRCAVKPFHDRLGPRRGIIGSSRHHQGRVDAALVGAVERCARVQQPQPRLE